MNCSFGPQDETMADESMAERRCVRNLVWEDYNGMECVTENTARLRRLAKVSASADDVLE